MSTTNNEEKWIGTTEAAEFLRNYLRIYLRRCRVAFQS